MWASMKAAGAGEAGGEVVEHDDEVPTLEQLQKAVGGYVEAFDLFDGKVTMWCNEESKLVAEPVQNPRATWLMVERGPGLFPGDYIAGDVAFTGPPDDEGETTGLDPAMLEEIRAGSNYTVLLMRR